MRATEYYSIVGDVPFVNVSVHRDNLLFLDPSAIRNAHDHPLGRRAHEYLVGFFGEVLRCRQSSSAADRAKGLALLQRLHEPNETRLGMSARGVAGHAFGDDLGERLWDELAVNPACRAAALSRLEDLRLFVDGVGNDLVSDLTTRVIFGVLADFTHQMVARYPSLARQRTSDTVDLWDPITCSWRAETVTLPYVAPHQLLLVPKRWIFWRTLMDPDAFYNHYGTGTVQRERTVRGRNGRLLSPSKKTLKEEFPHVRGLNTAQAAKYMNLGEDLVAAYRQRVDAEYEPLTNDQLERRT